MGKIDFYTIYDNTISLVASKEYIVDYIVDIKSTENGFVYVDIGDDKSDIKVDGLCDWSVTHIHGNIYKALNLKTAERAPFILDSGNIRLLTQLEIRIFNTAIRASLRHVFSSLKYDQYMKLIFVNGISGLFTELKREFISLYLGETPDIKDQQ